MARSPDRNAYAIDTKILPAITLLLVYQLVGEVIARALALPIPGPVIGMLLLFVTLVIRGRTPASVQTTANALLQHLSLLYIPAGVGILNLLRVKDDSIRGFSIGLASHGIGTARAFQISEEAGAFSGLAMGLNGAVTAVLIPILARLLGFF